MPKLRLKGVAQAQFLALPDRVRDEVELALLRIAANPTEEGTQLLGRLQGRWRTRVGGYRIVYRIAADGRLVIVDAIRPRADVY